MKKFFALPINFLIIRKLLLLYFFFEIFSFGINCSAYAATLYIDGNLVGNCNGNYSISGRICSGSDGKAYTTLSAGIAAGTTGTLLIFVVEAIQLFPQ